MTTATNTMTNFPDEHALAQEALKIAQGFANAHTAEVGGNNMGPQIETFQKSVGGEPGESWCLDAQVYFELKGLANLLKRKYTPDTIIDVCLSLHPILKHYHAITGSCGEFMRDAQKRGRWIDRSHVTVIRPGDLILYAWTDTAIENRVPAHVGRCTQQWLRAADEKISSLEGNTAPDSTGSQSDGDGVYLKHRKLANVVGIVKMFP
jgi:hypothetical protein